jgi:hypothetical protein
MTRTKKKSSPVNVIESAWDAFFQASRDKEADHEKLAAEGWKTLREIATAMDLPEPTVRGIIKREGFETTTHKVLIGGVRRMTLFARPKIP